jgi:hypothetical protein
MYGRAFVPSLEKDVSSMEGYKLVYVAHPIAGDIEGNIECVIGICSEIHKSESGVIPFAPYIVALQYLDDTVSAERELGMSANYEHFKRGNFDELWLAGPIISSGMKAEIECAREYGIPVKCYDSRLEKMLSEM